VARRDQYAQRPRADNEPQRRAEVHRLAIDSGLHRLGSGHLQAECGPGSPYRAVGFAGYVEQEDPEMTGVERRAGTASQRIIQRVGVVGHKNDGEMMVLVSQVVY